MVQWMLLNSKGMMPTSFVWEKKRVKKFTCWIWRKWDTNLCSCFSQLLILETKLRFYLGIKSYDVSFFTLIDLVVCPIRLKTIYKIPHLVTLYGVNRDRTYLGGCDRSVARLRSQFRFCWDGRLWLCLCPLFLNDTIQFVLFIKSYFTKLQGSERWSGFGRADVVFLKRMNLTW